MCGCPTGSWPCTTRMTTHMHGEQEDAECRGLLAAGIDGRVVLKRAETIFSSGCVRMVEVGTNCLQTPVLRAVTGERT
jgi:hypothetical protein